MGILHAIGNFLSNPDTLFALAAIGAVVLGIVGVLSGGLMFGGILAIVGGIGFPLVSYAASYIITSFDKTVINSNQEEDKGYSIKLKIDYDTLENRYIVHYKRKNLNTQKTKETVVDYNDLSDFGRGFQKEKIAGKKMKKLTVVCGDMKKLACESALDALRKRGNHIDDWNSE